MGRPRRDKCCCQSAFAGEGSHFSPSDAVVVAGGRIIPVGVETVVGGAVARRLVLGNGLRARRERFQVGRGPVQIVLHGLVRLLVQWGRDVEVRSLKDGVAPGCCAPSF